MIRIVLVDDHRVITDGLSAILSRHEDLEVIGTASSGREAVTMCTELRPDVVLMDLSMPDMDGVTATRNIVRGSASTRVVALTAFFDEQLVAEALEAGASGYLLKSIRGADLAEAIRDVARGRAALTLEALPGVASANNATKVSMQLTRRELEVLERLVLGETNKQIGVSLGLSSGTVRGHVSNILTKLHVENRTAAASYALRHGLATNHDR